MYTQTTSLHSVCVVYPIRFIITTLLRLINSNWNTRYIIHVTTVHMCFIIKVSNRLEQNPMILMSIRADINIVVRCDRHNFYFHHCQSTDINIYGRAEHWSNLQMFANLHVVFLNYMKALFVSLQQNCHYYYRCMHVKVQGSYVFKASVMWLPWDTKAL